MSWNNGYERKKFIKKLKHEAEEYRRHGMTEEQIEAIQSFDWEQFNSLRSHCEHVQELTISEFDDEGVETGRSPLYDKYADILTTTIGVVHISSGRYAWIKEMENEAMRDYLYSLDDRGKEIFTLTQEGYSQIEISALVGISQQAISKKIAKFRKIFEDRL